MPEHRYMKRMSKYTVYIQYINEGKKYKPDVIVTVV